MPRSRPPKLRNRWDDPRCYASHVRRHSRVTVGAHQPGILHRQHAGYQNYARRVRASALEWLRTQAPDVLRWSYEWLLAAEGGDDAPLLRGPNRQWLIEGMARRWLASTLTCAFLRSRKLVPHFVRREGSVFPFAERRCSNRSSQVYGSATSSGWAENFTCFATITLSERSATTSSR